MEKFALATEEEVHAGSTAMDDEAPVEELLRQLLGVIVDPTPYESKTIQRKPGTEQEVVLDVRLDGVRYILTRFPPPRSETARAKVALSPREKEIVRLIAKGLPNKTIAAVLEISPWTVSTHLRRIFLKLDVSCRAEMVARVLKEGLMRP